MQTFKIEFTQPQLDTINQLLMQAPYNISASIIMDINQQLLGQKSTNQEVVDIQDESADSLVTHRVW